MQCIARCKSNPFKQCSLKQCENKLCKKHLADKTVVTINLRYLYTCLRYFITLKSNYKTNSK